MKKTGVVIGRYQIFHKGHESLLKTALQQNDQVVVVLGSYKQARSSKNPFNAFERTEMIKSVFSKNEQEKLKFVYVRDKPLDDQWIQEIDNQLLECTDISIHNPSVSLYGHQKDESSFYLKMFPKWRFVNYTNFNGIDATTLRQKWFNNESISEFVSPSIEEFLTSFKKSEDFEKIKYEFQQIEKYKKDWSNTPFPSQFITVDAVVVNSKSILVVKRGENPGKGLFALPGGFVNSTERLETAAIRELIEETKIPVSKDLLKRFIVDKQIFDNPYRSSRGRTLTVAFLFFIDSHYFTPVSGADDAVEALWIPFKDLRSKEDLFFEDHFQIIEYCLEQRGLKF